MNMINNEVEPRADVELVKHKMLEMYGSTNEVDVAMNDLRSGLVCSLLQEEAGTEDADAGAEGDSDNEPDCGPITGEGLIRCSLKLQELLADYMVYPTRLVRETTFMVVDGEYIYNGNPNGSHYMNGVNESPDYLQLFPDDA